MSSIHLCANANIMFSLSEAQRTLKGMDLLGKGVTNVVWFTIKFDFWY